MTSEIVHKHMHLVTSLNYICSQVYYIRFNTISEKTPIYSFPAAKHPKHSKLGGSKRKTNIFY